MKTTTLSKLRACLSKLLRSVQAGEDILITQRGQPIAKLVPATRPNFVPDYPLEMEKPGLIKLGSGKLPKGFWDLPSLKDPKRLVAKAALREREES